MRRSSSARTLSRRRAHRACPPDRALSSCLPARIHFRRGRLGRAAAPCCASYAAPDAGYLLGARVSRSAAGTGGRARAASDRRRDRRPRWRAPASAPSLRASDVEIAPPAAEASFPPPIPLRSEGAAPAAIPTALEAALARLIVHDGPVDPLGDGDWRAPAPRSGLSTPTVGSPPSGSARPASRRRAARC